jgi:hypothetical protein
LTPAVGYFHRFDPRPARAYVALEPTGLAGAGGVLLVATALGAIFLPRIWEEWTETVIGLWVVVSPWLVGFASSESAKANAILSGLVILTLSLWTLQDEGGWLAPDKTA